MILLALLLASNSLGARAGQITHTVTYDPSKLSITYDTINGTAYARVNYENLLSYNLDGEPELPIDNLLFSVPYNASNFVVKIQVNNFTDITINNPVCPAQSPKELDDTTTSFTQPIASVYGMTSFYPSYQSKIVSTGYIYGDNKVIMTQLSPISYKPSTATLRIATNISLSIDYDIDSSIVPSLSRNNSTIKSMEMSLVAQNVINGSSVIMNSYNPQVLPPIIGNTPSLPTYNYCIITNRELEPAFKKIIAMKRQKGLSAGVVCMEDLMASPICNGGDNQGSLYPTITDSAGVVREYLKYAFNSPTSPTQYVMMGGKAPFAPVRFANSRRYPDSRSKSHVSCDMYFSNLSLPWIHWSSVFDGTNETEYLVPSMLDADKALPYYPDVFIGRLLCSSKDEIDNYSDKLFRYTFCPYNIDKSYLTKALFFSSGPVNANNVLGTANNAFDYVKHIKNSSYLYGWSGAQLVNYLNEYKYGYISLYAHGEPQSVAIYDQGNTKKILSALDSNPSNDSIYNVLEETGNGLDNLGNVKFPNICYSISCVTAPYDKALTYYCFTTCENKFNLGESFTLGKDYGGPAYLGNSRWGHIGISDILEKEFINCIFNRYYYSIGMAEAFSKVYYRLTRNTTYNHDILEHNLLGDPEFEMWTSEPQRYSNISVSRYEHSILVQGININDTVSYCDNDGNVGRANGNSNGYVVLTNISPNSSIMIYNHDHIPYIVPLMLQNCNINNSQYVYASSFSAGNSVVPNITHGNVIIKNGAVYEIDATDDVHLGEGFIVENGATFAIKTPGKVTIDGCVFQGGANVKIEAGMVEIVKSFTAELGSKVEITQYVE